MEVGILTKLSDRRPDEGQRQRWPSLTGSRYSKACTSASIQYTIATKFQWKHPAGFRHNSNLEYRNDKAADVRMSGKSRWPPLIGNRNRCKKRKYAWFSKIISHLSGF